MQSLQVLLWIILAVVAASLWYLIQALGGWQVVGESVGIVPTTTPTTSTAPLETITPSANPFTSDDSRFSQGHCTQDSDCMVSGCSGEVCGVADAVTTCEFSESFPSTETHQCGCVQSVCGWTAR